MTKNHDGITTALGQPSILIKILVDVAKGAR